MDRVLSVLAQGGQYRPQFPSPCPHPHFPLIPFPRAPLLSHPIPSPSAPDWPSLIHAVFRRSRIRQVAYVPDAGHARLITLCHDDASLRAVPLTTEEEGVALAAGAWLGGDRSALLMQSSGVGNCVNMLAMTRACRFPLLMLVTMRGEFEEFNPWQVPMGTSAQSVLQLAGLEVRRVDDAASVEPAVEWAAEQAFGHDAAVAVLLSQRLIGRKEWVK